MAVHFTEDQQKAIDTLDRSILVSAAAGSGKTAVLVERIIHIIKSGQANVDELLVVTFTNAAASEMKMKVTKAIQKHMKEHPEDRALMSRQLNRMYRSYISTFHGFAKRIIREFFYKIDREPSFGICDDAQSSLMQMEALEELFDQCFEKDDYIPGGSFKGFLERYSSDRNENGLMSEMLSTYGSLRSVPNYFDWAFRKAEMMRIPESGDITESPIFQMVMSRTKSEITRALDDCNALIDYLNPYGIESIQKILEKDYEYFEGVLDALEYPKDESGQVRDDLLPPYTFPQLRVAKAEKDMYTGEVKDYVSAIRKKYKDLYNALRAEFFVPSLSESFKEMDEAYRYTVYYLRLLQEFENRFDAKKREANLMDFGDLEHTAVRILEDPEVSEVLRKRFKFIFIDEYQDTNKLQEYLISMVARSNNLFKVGDVKQSIYGFRESDPKIFMATRREYEKPENTEAMVIDLNRNFRSSGSTIRYINDVFDGIMPGYDEKECLYQGLKGRPEMDMVPEVHILPENAGDDSDDEEDSLERSELEANYVAKLVGNIIGTEFYDGKQDVVRKATPRDIVILGRSINSSADIYYRAMLSQNIPAFMSDDGDYYEAVEIKVAMALLKLIDNGHQDVPLLAVLRSEIFGFKPEELAQIRIIYKEAGGTGGFYKAYEYGLAHPEKLENIRVTEMNLAEKIRHAEEKIQEWRYLSNKMPLDEYIWYILTESGYYLYAGAMYGGQQRQANLRVLAERAASFQTRGLTTLHEFIRYTDSLQKMQFKAAQPSMVSEDADVVRIMTMHKSKGLEFPFVIIVGMGKRKKTDSRNKGFYFDSDLGVSLSYVSKEDQFWRTTLLQNLIYDKKKEEVFQEELRILYVAMTRAREKLMMVGTCKDEEKLRNGVPGTSTFYEIIKNKLFIPSVRYMIAEPEAKKYFQKRNRFEDFENARAQFVGDPEAEKMEALVAKRLGYTYPKSEALETKSKYTVSEMNALAETASRKRRIDLDTPEFTEVVKVTGAEIGTAYHRIMEGLSFTQVLKDDCVNQSYIEEVATGLRESGAIPEEIYATLDFQMIARFFDSDLGRRAVQAASRGQLWKEKPFTLQKEVKGEKVLVQGIIDCFFQEEEHIVLVDYKSNRVLENTAEIADMYREQIYLYREALELSTGMKVAESYLYLLRMGICLPMQE